MKLRGLNTMTTMKMLGVKASGHGVSVHFTAYLRSIQRHGELVIR